MLCAAWRGAEAGAKKSILSVVVHISVICNGCMAHPLLVDRLHTTCARMSDAET